MARQTAVQECGARQPQIDQHRATMDGEQSRVVALLDSLLFISRSDAPMGMWVKFVRYLAEGGVPGFPKKGYGTYYTTEALAAKTAAEKIQAFNVIDTVIRTVGIHSVWWLSWGDAVLRLVAVLPALIVMLKEWDANLYALVTSYRFHFLLFFIADVLEQLNILNRVFQQKELDYAGVHAQIKRTTSHIESRYIDCGDDFGGGVSELLSPFIARHGPGGNREVKVEGIDSDGRPARFKFMLHEDELEEFERPGTHDDCVSLCTEFAEVIVHQLEHRLGDLDGMSGVKLFLPDEYPLDRAERKRRCLQWLQSLVTLFKADLTEEIVPAVMLKDARLGELMCMSLMDYEPNWEEIVTIWRACKKRKPHSNAPLPPAEKQQNKAKEAEEVMEVEDIEQDDDASDSDDDGFDE
ncbi:unnamed protein product [Closterium sp. Naga37s-1]|nr:unnamed protein product [Closterium sp. Naga37s-1]